MRRKHALIALALLACCEASAQTVSNLVLNNVSSVIMPPQPSVSPALAALFHWLKPHVASLYWSLAAFMGSCRIYAKPVNARIQQWMSSFAASHTSALDSDLNRAINKLLAWWPFVVVQFAADWLVSVKLPTAASYAAELAAQSKAAPVRTL